MNLYVNGCSYTHGHKDWGELDPMNPDSPPSWVWPSMLQPEFDKVVNQAWRGTSNKRIVRRTIDYLSTITNPADWWVVIQLTSPERTEWFDDDTLSWVSQLFDQTVYDDWAKDCLSDQPRINRKSQLAMPYVNEIRHDEQKILDLFYNIITLETFFKARGFNKVLYTSMARSGNYKYHLDVLNESIATDTMLVNQYINKNSPNIHLFRQLTTLLDGDKFLKPMSIVTEGHEDTDGHPNKEGHRIFSRYIVNEMEKRA